MRRFIISAMLAVLPVLAYADAQEARLLRFPSVGGDQIAFTYAGDLYTVSIDGGKAVRLTSDVGYEIFSRFSPDGKTIAFTAQYDGNTEVYTMPAEGGVPQRITYTATVDRDNIGDRALSADCSSQCLQRAASLCRYPPQRAASAPILPTAPSWP